MTERPLRADARRNRERVLEVAREMFVERGLSVPIDEIAQRAGVGVGTIYRHFPTKEALFGAVVVDGVQRVLDQAKAAIDVDDPGQAFFDFFTYMIEEAMTNKALYQTVSEVEGIGLDRISGLGAELMDVEGVLLARAQQAGAVRKDVDVHDLKAITSGCMAMESQSQNRGRMIAIVRDGLRPPL